MRRPCAERLSCGAPGRTREGGRRRRSAPGLQPGDLADRTTVKPTVSGKLLAPDARLREQAAAEVPRPHERGGKELLTRAWEGRGACDHSRSGRVGADRQVPGRFPWILTSHSVTVRSSCPFFRALPSPWRNPHQARWLRESEKSCPDQGSLGNGEVRLEPSSSRGLSRASTVSLAKRVMPEGTP